MIADLIRETQTIDDVIGTMRRIDAALADDDGVKWFNFLYLSVTEAVQADAAAWQDWPFLQRFDVLFARLYFDALAASERNADLMAPAWRPLFTARHDTRLARLQFALAGMNAHINPICRWRWSALRQPRGRSHRGRARAITTSWASTTFSNAPSRRSGRC